MATNALFNLWRTFHAKFIKPVDRALDSFSLLMLQWLLGTYNIWDVLKISGSFFLSAIQSLANIVRNPSLIWKSEAPNADKSEGEISVMEEEEGTGAEEQDKRGEHDEAADKSCSESDQTIEEAEYCLEPVQYKMNGESTKEGIRLRESAGQGDQ